MVGFYTARSSILLSVYMYIVPGPVEELMVHVVNQSLNISWESPTEPNDYTWNYTVTVTTGTNTLPTLHTLSNETQITVDTKIGM